MCFQIQKIREWGSLFSNSGVRENKNVCFQDQKTHQIFLVLIAGYEFGLVPVGGLSGGCLVDLHRIRVEEFARFLPRSGLRVFCELQQSIFIDFFPMENPFLRFSNHFLDVFGCFPVVWVGWFCARSLHHFEQCAIVQTEIASLKVGTQDSSSTDPRHRMHSLSNLWIR